MKRINNKYRNNNNNNGGSQIYSLNYKFDSTSPAGKCCGTALDLIKRYNELAKDAAGNNDYVTAEVFRQYAEHYRKIVTDINEKKNQYRTQNPQTAETVENQPTETPAPVAETAPEKSFTVVEVPHTEAETAGEASAAGTEEPARKKRVYRRRQTAAE